VFVRLLLLLLLLLRCPDLAVHNHAAPSLSAANTLQMGLDLAGQYWRSTLKKSSAAGVTAGWEHTQWSTRLIGVDRGQSLTVVNS
jgi:hypothetical protein